MLDIAISLGLVYLMLAAMVSGVQELLASTADQSRMRRSASAPRR